MKKELFKYPESEKGVVDDFYREIFHEKEYDRYGARIEAGDVVFDCGAFIGQFAHFALLKGAKQVYSLELMPHNYECLVENTKMCPKVKPYLGRFSNHRDSSDAYNLERIMEENNLQYIDFAKIDIEGIELDTLIDMDPNLMARVNKWAIELHPHWDTGKETSGKRWPHGIDFSGHTASKILHIIEKFTVNGFKIAYEHIHKDYNIAMLYAWK